MKCKICGGEIGVVTCGNAYYGEKNMIMFYCQNKCHGILFKMYLDPRLIDELEKTVEKKDA
jgi:ribosomal protein L24E